MTVSRRRALGLLAASATALATGCRNRRTVSLLTWGDYVAREVLDRFAAKHGARVVEDLFLAEAEMQAKLEAGGEYDVAATIDYLLNTLQRERLIAELDPMPAGADHLAPEFPPWRARDDRGGGVYAIPYLWGTTGIGYDSEKVDRVDSWSALFDERYAGRISVLDSKGDVMDQALLAAGMDINSTDKARLRAEIRPKLLAQKQILRAYDPDPARALVRGETWIAQIDSGDLLRAQRQKPSLRYVIPREGAARWTDYLVLPARARQVALARKLIEHFLDPEIAALNANELRFATPNATALERGLITDADDPNIYPPPEVAARLFGSENWFGNTGNLVGEIWLELRAA